MSKEKMTQREFLETIVSLDNISSDLVDFAKGRIKVLDETNERRKGKAKKLSDAEVEKRLARISEVLAVLEKGVPVLAKDVAIKLDITPQLASATLKQMVEKGMITKIVPENRNKPFEYLLAE